jgi:RNA polymerase sigma-70 factor (ECF subfamily)
MFSSLTVNSFYQGEGFIPFPHFSWKWFLAFFEADSKGQSLAALSDDQCLQKAAKGDERAFSELFNRYGDLVFGYCIKLLKDREQAEDISQEVWVKVIRNSDKYTSKGQFKAWLLQITRNACFSFFRKQKVRRAEDIEDYEVEDVDQQSILDLISIEEDRDRVKECIKELPENQRVALVIWMTEDKSYEDIAKDMEVSVSSIKSLLFRSRQNLKEMLSR